MSTAADRGAEVRVTAGPCDGHPAVTLRTGLLAPRILGTSPGTARVALVATGATLLGGDAVLLRLVVGAGQRLLLEDVAATVAYDGRGRPARWDVEASVAEGGTLVWHGEPLVVADGADVTRTMRLDVAAGGRALVRDVVVLGRHGERGGGLRCTTETSHAGVPLLVEELDLTAGPDPLRDAPGVLAGHRVVETLTLVGASGTTPAALPDASAARGQEQAEPADPGEGQTVLLGLAGAGQVVRRLSSDAHGSPLAAVWRELRASVTQAPALVAVA